MTIAIHVNELYTASPGMQTLAAGAGVTERAARSAVRRLEKNGIIKTKRGGGRKRPSSYTINTEGLEDPELVDKPGTTGLPGFRQQNRKPNDLNPEVSYNKPGSPRVPPKRGKEIKEQQQGAAADSEIISELTLAGIDKDKRLELAELPGITAQIVKSKAARCREQGKGAGILIRELKTASEQHLERERRRQHREQRQQEDQDDGPRMTYAELKAEQERAGPLTGPSG